jgi:periplasmic protein TonB
MHALIEDEERVETQIGEALQLVETRSPARPIRRKALFADSLLETSGGQRRRRTWATFVSLVLQCVLVSVLVLVPLWFTDVLPSQQMVTFLVAPAPPPPPPPPAARASATVKVVKVATDIVNGQLRTPGRIPEKVQMIKEAEEPPPITTTGGVVGGVPGGIPGGQLGGVIGSIISESSRLAAVPKLSKPAPTVQRVRVSQGVTKGMVVYRIEPAYPPLAREARIQGVVVLTAIINKDGNIENLQLVSGHPMLAPAAIDAVKHWRYKPFLLNGQPVEVETTVTVNFRMEM